MKKPTIEKVAELLCKGKPVPDWVAQRLHDRAALVSDTTEDQGDDIERLLFESALYLRDLLQLYTRAYRMIGEEYPSCIDDVDRALDELLPILAEGVEQPKRGKPINLNRHLCAAVCMGIWTEVHGRPQPHSPKLWEACEAYWVACGREGYSSAHIKNWEDYLLA
jgi:hypothetical protein